MSSVMSGFMVGVMSGVMSDIMSVVMVGVMSDIMSDVMSAMKCLNFFIAGSTAMHLEYKFGKMGLAKLLVFRSWCQFRGLSNF